MMREISVPVNLRCREQTECREQHEVWNNVSMLVRNTLALLDSLSPDISLKADSSHIRTRELLVTDGSRYLHKRIVATLTKSLAMLAY